LFSAKAGQEITGLIRGIIVAPDKIPR